MTKTKEFEFFISAPKLPACCLVYKLQEFKRSKFSHLGTIKHYMYTVLSFYVCLSGTPSTASWDGARLIYSRESSLRQQTVLPKHFHFSTLTRGIFFLCPFQHGVICNPSDSTVSENAGTALAVRRSKHSVKSHPQLGLDIIENITRKNLKKINGLWLSCCISRGDLQAFSWHLFICSSITPSILSRRVFLVFWPFLFSSHDFLLRDHVLKKVFFSVWFRNKINLSSVTWISSRQDRFLSFCHYMFISPWHLFTVVRIRIRCYLFRILSNLFRIRSNWFWIQVI